MKKNVAFFLTAIIILLPSCKMDTQADSKSDSSFSEAPPVITVELDTSEGPNVHAVESERSGINDPLAPSQEQSGSYGYNLKTDMPDLSYTPALSVCDSLGKGIQVVAEYADDIWRDTDSRYFYLLADETVFDILVSIVHNNDYDELIESLGLFYYPELKAGEAISFTGVQEQCEPMHSFCKIAYTNCEGEYEATIMVYNGATPVLVPIDSMPWETLYDTQYYDRQTGKFHEKLISGVFSDYIPAGFCVSAGSLGDINADGIEDALLCLSTGGYRAAAYFGIMPLFLLIGQQEGGYSIEQRISDVLFTPYRSSSCVIVNKGDIDVVFNINDGAARNYTQIGRFRYDAKRNDWLLKELSYQPAFDDSGLTIPTFVRAIPHCLDIPLSCYNRNTFYNNLAEWSRFDAVESISIHSYSGYNDTFKIAINVNRAGGCYEGYIYHCDESLESGGFIQTIRGEYEMDSKLKVVIDESKRAFSVQGDVWKMSEFEDSMFILYR